MVLSGERLSVRKFLNDPLVHFLAAGAVLFAIGSAANPSDPDEDAIVVDRAALLGFIQYRSKAFEATAAATMLDGFDNAARANLIREYVREEALAREAAALGLDANDYVIRQRMVQKVEFLAEAAAPAAEPSDADVAGFYDANRDRYASPPSATLTHVFVSTEKNPPEAARATALGLLQTLRDDGAGFSDATRYGDRFLFHKNYVDRTDDYIMSQLGEEIAGAVFDPSSPLDEWRGPYRSQYGDHLIFVSARTPASTPPLDAIRELVKSDLTEEMRQKEIDAAIDEIVAKYKIDDRVSAGD